MPGGSPATHVHDFPNESSFKSTNLWFFFPTLNQERFILKVASVGLVADPSSQASSKVKKKERLYLGLGHQKHKVELLLLSL